MTNMWNIGQKDDKHHIFLFRNFTGAYPDVCSYTSIRHKSERKVGKLSYRLPLDAPAVRTFVNTGEAVGLTFTSGLWLAGYRP